MLFVSTSLLTYSGKNTFICHSRAARYFASIVHMVELSAVASIALKEEDEQQQQQHTNTQTQKKFLRL